MKVYRGESVGRTRTVFVKTGEFRPPKKGEFFLSGAIPQAYRAFEDLTQAFHIMRPATPEEAICPTCGRPYSTQE